MSRGKTFELKFVKHECIRESSQVRLSQRVGTLEARTSPLTSKIKPACGVRSACQRPLEADVCDHVGAGVLEWRGRPLFAYVRENRAGVYASASMADKCVS